MDYSQLSDFEINKRVAETTGEQVEETYQFVNGGEDIADHMSGIVLMRKITSNRKHWRLYDPCNSAADAWPIIEKQLIRIMPVVIGEKTQWVCSRDIHASASEKPLRAAMIVFLQMQDAKHA